MEQPVYVDDLPIDQGEATIEGNLVNLEDGRFYRISHFDRMPPFFMTIVSGSDHWMFISSNGGLTAGRRNAEHAVFPYTTDDKIHDSQEITGSKTIVLVEQNDRKLLWEPFSERYRGIYHTKRNIYKHVLGNRVRFEEVNEDLGLVFSYDWTNSEAYGLVKHARLSNQSAEPVSVRVLDGVQNLLPYGVDQHMQSGFSTLLDAYKKNELLPDSGIGLFLLSSIPVDRPEPSEALKATTVWSVGLEKPLHLLTTRQLDRFRQGESVVEETDIRAERGAYFVASSLTLEAKDGHDWIFAIEGDQDSSDVAALTALLEDASEARTRLEEDVRLNGLRLLQIVAGADGLQETRDHLTCARHFSNALFNVMRGGVFLTNYRLDRDDLLAFLEHHNRDVLQRHQAKIASQPDEIDLVNLRHLAEESGDADFERLCTEYLPLAFSRRHGDPSRPWNIFSIEVRKEDGSRNLDYQGNWRDIFQNWEALALSYPAFLEGMIYKFVNASTADGYNPYRVNRDGIDWEVLDPENPWSYIGYWGDHQIVYLLKLLEIWHDHQPDALRRTLGRELFVYANVPYRIRSYEDLTKNPHDTIVYDGEEEKRVTSRVAKAGADGKLIWNSDQQPYHVTLAEKLLVPALAKLSNLIPEAGIWMNTQRPEWNDANNALVGYGVSVVTACYLRRYLAFLRGLFDEENRDAVALSQEVADHLAEINGIFDSWEEQLKGPLSDTTRKSMVDALGRSGSDYRTNIYHDGFSGARQSVDIAGIARFLDLSIQWIDHTIRANERPDKLYHAYNLVDLDKEEELRSTALYEMLEGQVAALSAGCLTADESVQVLEALRQSALYREDQHSYILYPNRMLPRFLEKNRIPPDWVSESVLVSRLLEDGNRRLVVRDVAGELHFNGAFRNAGDIVAALDELRKEGYAEEVERDRELVLDTFEEMFDHRSYTGRSGTFFGYEGLGSIYWHMVSKLLLAVKEIFYRAPAEERDPSVRDRLRELYYDIREGIGVDKNPKNYGAFPIDPYSHTPAHAGAQQPGMTGQVKEDIIARWGELGIRIENGQVMFVPGLLRASEFLSEPSEFAYIAVDGGTRKISLDTGTLAYTYCQVPVVYRKGATPGISVTMADGSARHISGARLDRTSSSAIFGRTAEVALVEVTLAQEQGR